MPVHSKALPYKADVIQIGPTPPPYGGVSVHVGRLVQLCASSGMNVHVVDYSKRFTGFQCAWPISRALLIDAHRRLLGRARESRRIVHFHASAMAGFDHWAPFVLPLIRGAARVLTIHGGAFPGRVEKLPLHRLRRLEQVLSSMDHIVAVSESIADVLHRICRVAFEKVSIIPAFIPPVSVYAGSASLPPPSCVVDLRRRVKCMLLTSGYLERHSGFEVLLRAASALNGYVGVVVVGYGTRDDALLQELKRLSAAVRSCVIVEGLEPQAFQATLRACDAYVRPTAWDGDSVAVREALSACKPVIASDAVARPAGCRLFRTGDVSDLERAIREVSSNTRAATLETERPMENPGLQIIELYKQLLMNRGARRI